MLSNCVVLALAFVVRSSFTLSTFEDSRNKTWINFLTRWMFQTNTNQMLVQSMLSCKEALKKFSLRIGVKLVPQLLIFDQKEITRIRSPLGRLLAVEMKQPITIQLKQYIDLGMNITFLDVQLPYTGVFCDIEYMAVYGYFNRKQIINPVGPFCGIKSVFSVFSSHYEVVFGYVHRQSYCTTSKHKIDFVYQVIDAGFLITRQCFQTLCRIYLGSKDSII